MKDYRIKAIARGLAIIAFAICLLLSKTGAFTAFPLVKIGMSIILGLVIIEALFEKSFLGVFFSLGLMACLFQKELGLVSVSYAIIILAFVLIGIGFTIIFDKKPKISVIKDGHKDSVESAGNIEYWEDDGNFSIDNSLGQKTQYVKIQNLKKGDIDNSLGSLTVYLTGSTVDADGAVLDIDNGMGSLTVYFPKNFRVHFNCDNGMGKINMHGECSQDESQPLVKANVDNGMGTIDFYFE